MEHASLEYPTGSFPILTVRLKRHTLCLLVLAGEFVVDIRVPVIGVKLVSRFLPHLEFHGLEASTAILIVLCIFWVENRRRVHRIN